MKSKKLKQIIKASYFGYKAYTLYDKFYNRKKKRLWMKRYHRDRNLYGWYETSYRALKDDHALFYETVRMRPQRFDILLSLLKPKLSKNSIRKPINEECRFFLTLEYLAQGGSRTLFARKYRMAKCTVGKIILETCSVIWDELSTIYLVAPKKEEYIKISKQYHQKFNLPNCLGAIDGKHISIVCPPKSGSDFFNYKKRFSIVLLGVCDANYTFTIVDIGAFGSQSDGSIFKNSAFGKKLVKNEMNDIPHSALLPNSELNFPYYFVADNAFPLKRYIMRPFPGKNLNSEKLNFNRRISRARVTIENTFGIMACRWRVLLNDIHCYPENVDKIVKACVVLHNYLRLADVSYCPEGYGDTFSSDGEIIPGSWRAENMELTRSPLNPTNNASREAFFLREKLSEYLLNN